jgi:hypothetical protein
MRRKRKQVRTTWEKKEVKRKGRKMRKFIGTDKWCGTCGNSRGIRCRVLEKQE